MHAKTVSQPPVCPQASLKSSVIFCSPHRVHVISASLSDILVSDIINASSINSAAEKLETKRNKRLKKTSSTPKDQKKLDILLKQTKSKQNLIVLKKRPILQHEQHS
ncbi:hypothetical protein RRG08_031697 [Elysia crispata]|uniref:Uncharacterized protein n=1 Tax=Elysia crispata TaxID=231223 RepID=A0AAE1DUT3_9GAST|nr:hypothetical protein RRG08_031697 [Elysia crispata]